MTLNTIRSIFYFQNTKKISLSSVTMLRYQERLVLVQVFFHIVTFIKHYAVPAGTRHRVIASHVPPHMTLLARGPGAKDQ